jgi:hypothetical protein
MGYISNNQSFIAGASGTVGGTTLENQFRTAMDGVLIGLGRDITIHLPPSQDPCTAPGCTFNPFYQRYTGVSGIFCEVCKGQGFVLEPRWTTYRANIRWTDESMNGSKDTRETSEVGRQGQNFVRTKTVASAYNHIKESIGATIDGVDVELHEEPRYTGFGSQVLYTISWWKVANR